MPLLPHALATSLLERSIYRAMRRELGGVFVHGSLHSAGTVVIAGHQSWWDGYVVGAAVRSCGTDPGIMMSAEQLDRFPFLRLVGARAPHELRSLAAMARAGRPVIVFPEGEQLRTDRQRPFRRGAQWLAEYARVPLTPLAVRVDLRDGPRPMAFARFGSPVSPDAGPHGLRLARAELDADLDAVVQARDSDDPPIGYREIVRGNSARHDRGRFTDRLFARVTGFTAATPTARGQRGSS